MPLDEEYGAQIYEGPADLINVSTQFCSALLRDSSDVRVSAYTSDCTIGQRIVIVGGGSPPGVECDARQR